jgi:hypothetical protein
MHGEFAAFRGQDDVAEIIAAGISNTVLIAEFLLDAVVDV